MGIHKTTTPTASATQSSQALQATEKATSREEPVGKTNVGRSVQKMPNIFQRLVNKFKAFRNPDSQGNVLGQPTKNNAIADRIVAESVGQENKTLLQEIRQGVKLRSQDEVRKAQEQKLLTKYVYADPRYAKTMAEFKLAEDHRRTREQLNTEIGQLNDEITDLKTRGEYETNKVTIDARMSDLRRKFKALDMEDKGINDLKQYRQMELDNKCHLQGTVLEILQDTLTQYEDMLKVQGVPADQQHDYEYFALQNLVNKTREEYLDLTSKIDTIEDDDDEYFDALEYQEDGDEFFDALEYQPDDKRQQNK